MADNSKKSSGLSGLLRSASQKLTRNKSVSHVVHNNKNDVDELTEIADTSWIKDTDDLSALQDPGDGKYDLPQRKKSSKSPQRTRESGGATPGKGEEAALSPKRVGFQEPQVGFIEKRSSTTAKAKAITTQSLYRESSQKNSLFRENSAKVLESESPGGLVGIFRSKSSTNPTLDIRRGPSKSNAAPPTMLRTRRQTETLQTTPLVRSTSTNLARANSARSTISAQETLVTGSREPSLIFYPYKTDRWYMDPFTILHNAIRRELIDMHRILNHIQFLTQPTDDVQRRLSIISVVDDWFHDFIGFIMLYCKIHHKILLPWIINKEMEETEPETPKIKRYYANLRNSIKQRCDTLLNILDTVFDVNVSHIISEGNLKLLIKKSDDLSLHLVNVFRDQEQKVPKLVKRFCYQADVPGIEKQVGREVMASPKAALYVPVLLYWISDRESKRIWIASRFGNNLMKINKWMSNIEATDHKQTVPFVERET